MILIQENTNISLHLNFKKIENKAYRLSNQTQKVPAQKLSDFMNDKLSVNIPKTSYIPGTISVKMSELFPRFIYETLRGAFRV